MSDPFSPERKTVCLKKQNLFGSGYAGLGSYISRWLMLTGEKGKTWEDYLDLYSSRVGANPGVLVPGACGQRLLPHAVRPRSRRYHYLFQLPR
jgi:hypothetical protein